MLIQRVQLPEDNALSQTATQATQGPNSSTTSTSPGTEAATEGTTPQNSETTAPETQPPTAGRTTGTTGTDRTTLVRYLIDHIRSDPHMRTCRSQSPSPTNSELGTNHHVRAHSIILPDCGQSARDVVLSTPSGSGGYVFDVLVTSGCTIRPERTNCGFDYRVPCWDDDLSVVICLLFVSGYSYVCLG